LYHADWGWKAGKCVFYYPDWGVLRTRKAKRTWGPRASDHGFGSLGGRGVNALWLIGLSD
jgi:hypothetical protein